MGFQYTHLTVLCCSAPFCLPGCTAAAASLCAITHPSVLAPDPIFLLRASLKSRNVSMPVVYVDARSVCVGSCPQHSPQRCRNTCALAHDPAGSNMCARKGSSVRAVFNCRATDPVEDAWAGAMPRYVTYRVRSDNVPRMILTR